MTILSNSNPSSARAGSLIIPILVVCAGFIFLTFDILISNSRPTVKSIVLIAGGISYLLLRKRISSNLHLTLSEKPAISLLIPFILNIFFLSLFFLILFSAVTADAYSIPLNYLIFAAVMCVTIVLDILILPLNNRLYIYVILLKILATSLLLITIPHYFFPNIGQDYWEHMNLTNGILSEYHLPSVGYEYYKDFAGMHLIVAAVDAITNLKIQPSMMIIGIIQVASLISLFCIGRTVFNNKVALLGILIAGISGSFIFWGYYIIPMSLGIGLLSIFLFLRIKILQVTNKLPFVFFWLIIAATVIYIHTIVGVIFCVILISMFLADQFLHRWSRKKLPVVSSFSTPLWFLVILLGYWMYISGYWFSEFSRILDKVFSLPTFETTGVITGITQNEVFLQELGFTLLLSFLVLGFLHNWQHRRDYRYALLLLASFIGLAMVLFISGLLGISEVLLPDRWEPFIYVVIALLSAQGAYLLYHIAKSKTLMLPIMGLITLVLSFALISTSLVGHSNPNAIREVSTRGYWLDSEVAAANRITGLYQGEIVSDLYYSSYFYCNFNAQTSGLYQYLIDNLGDNHAIIVRDYILNYPFRTKYTGSELTSYSSISVELDDTQKQVIGDLGEKPGSNIVYTNSEVTLYLLSPIIK